VDIRALLRAYPAYRALGALDIAVTPVPPAGRPVPCLTFPPIAPPSADGLLDGRARQQLEAQTAGDAVVALARLEAVRHASLDAKLRLLRADLVRRSAAEIDAEIRAIEAERSKLLSDALCCLAIERINALLRISALQAQMDVPILDQKSVNAKLACEKDQLGILEDRRATERTRIEREFAEQIEERARIAAAEIAEQMSAIEQEGRQEIAADIRQARAALLSDLSERNGSSSYAAARRVIPARASVTICPGLRFVQGPRQGENRRRAVASVKAQMRASVERAIRTAAEQEGMRVSFSPKAGLPDETAMMLRIMRERAWGASESLSKGGAS
jgi:hypothetical protein